MSFSEQFANKVVAITGAASGIGLATAHLLASRGALLSLADIQSSALEAASTAIKAAHPTAQILTTPLDVRDLAAVSSWITTTVATYGRLDGAANLAGIIPSPLIQPLPDTDAAAWAAVLDVNVTGLMHCLRAQLGVIADGGSVVNAGSIAALTGWKNLSAYSTSKHAILGMTRSAAKEMAYREVRVNAVCPGMIDTPLLSASSYKLSDQIHIRRFGRPDEVARLIAFLLSDESTYISGSDITIDGAWHC